MKNKETLYNLKFKFNLKIIYFKKLNYYKMYYL